MPSGDRQLPLALPHQGAMSRADFLVGAGNERAIDLVDRWPAWPERGAFLYGPPGSGKSHLVAIWQAASGAAIVPGAALDMSAAEEAIAAGAVAIEDLHSGPLDERALFHLLNVATERRIPLLVTSRSGPADLAVGLADLASRLRAMLLIELERPDDDLLRRVLIKLFADRQLSVEPAVVDFIVVRMERSLEAANALSALIDEEALAGGRPITRRLAGEALAALGGPSFPDEA